MTENWEPALNNARDDFITFIGDDNSSTPTHASWPPKFSQTPRNWPDHGFGRGSRRQSISNHVSHLGFRTIQKIVHAGKSAPRESFGLRV
jgi:hypothetical protein